MFNLDILKRRDAFLREVRSFFQERDYIEIQTPVRLPSIIPEPFIEPIASEEQFLQTSPELCMKRLLSAGAERIFQICPCFRKGERGRLHLPEFTMLEWYCVGTDYFSMMDECEEMIRNVAGKCNPEMMARWGEEPWEKLSVSRAFDEYCQCSLDEALAADKFEEMLVEEIEPSLAETGAVFLYDYPSSMASLARLRPDNRQVAERFELYLSGIEIANGFSELIDHDEQRLRFTGDRETIQKAGRDPGPFPGKFLDDLALMPESAGIALGLDRLVMLLADLECVDDVVPFTPENL